MGRNGHVEYANRTTPKRYPALYEWLAANGRSLKWLSEATGIGYNNLHDKMKMRNNMLPEDIKKICKATGMTEKELRRNETHFTNW